jgi:hypothetical protein
MKLFFISILLVISTAIYSQQPPRGTFQIVVYNQLSKEENLQKVTQVLLENGFLVPVKDTVYYYIESNRIRMPGFTASYSLHFIVKEKSVTVFGKLTDSYMPNTLSKLVYVQVVNTGSKNSAQRVSFLIMHRIALKIGDNPNFLTLKNAISVKSSDKEEYDDIYK